MIEMTDYEKRQLEEINEWEKKTPLMKMKIPYVSDSLEYAKNIFDKYVPEEALSPVLNLANKVGDKFTDKKDILMYSGAREIEELKSIKLELSDWLAAKVHKRAVAAVVAEGAAVGAGGWATLPVDIAFLIPFSLRTIHKIGLCYGYVCDNDKERDFIYSILSLSAANSEEERSDAMAFQVAIGGQLATDAAIKYARLFIGKDAAFKVVKNLFRQVGINVTRRRLLAFIPIISSAIGATTNGLYMKDVCWAARRSFQKRWLADNQKIPAAANE